jgi:hypothetical protein
MRYLIYSALLLGTLISACGNSNTEHIEGKNYIVDTWMVDNQTIHFRGDSTMMILTPLRDDSTNAVPLDTMMAYYSYQPDSTPMQLDMHIYTGALDGMRLFGIIEQTHTDTFRLVATKGFEGQGAKYRPKTMEGGRVVTYARTK